MDCCIELNDEIKIIDNNIILSLGQIDLMKQLYKLIRFLTL